MNDVKKDLTLDAQTPEFRASYPHLFEPKANDLKRDPKTNEPVMEYSVTALFPLNADLSALVKILNNAAVKRWGNDPNKWPAKIIHAAKKKWECTPEDEASDLYLPIRHQSGQKKDGVLKAGYTEGAKFCAFRTRATPSQPPPGVFDQRNQRIPVADQTKVYAGCWMRAFVTAGSFPGPNAKPGIKPGVTLYLNAAQLIRDGEPLANRIDVERAFAPVEGFENNDAGSAFDSII